ncbi:MAG: WecB/TagA/CpsF family glycosyltransferase [Candidatus Bipolaricaulota bacterium]|nr:WecB/TagA/CpsF family glycosyltransferase [Candidatus Bipolaricaulota bacterium]MBS3791639.1 WecB/TagA/CpsF family glycosyltransferase [Candidatus Bipolaricaulota bacterium]
MINAMPGAVSFVSFILVAGAFGGSRKWDKLSKFADFLPLIVPASAGLISGFSPPIIGLLASLLIIAGAKKLGKGSKLVEYVSFLAAGLVFALIGFRIQFIQMATTGEFVYFTWLSIPLTVTWLLLISRSVEFVHAELDREKWRLFLVTLIFIGLSFLLIVILQPEQKLTTAFQLGLAFVGTSVGLLFFGRRKEFSSVLFRQLGFILASLALVGLVKSLTALVLLVPIAPLAIPAARGSFAFTSTASSAGVNSSLLDRTMEEYLGSSSLGIVLIYISLSYAGLASWWYIRYPGIVQAATLSLGAVLLPSLFFVANRAVARLRTLKPSLLQTGPETGKIFGTSFNFSKLKNTSRKVKRLANSKPTSYVATPDVTAVVRAKNDELLSRAFARADVVTPDGFGLIWASRVHDLPLKQRVAGIDLVEDVLGSEEKVKVYLLGSRPGVAEKAGKNLTERYEGVEITGTHHGYIPVDRREIVSEINEIGPDLLLVGMGVPKQEDWITEHIDSLNANVVMGVGGSFDVLSGNLPRAPQWMRHRGLEWLYRIWLEPKRLGKARLIPYFMAKVYWEKAKLALKDEIL